MNLPHPVIFVLRRVSFPARPSTEGIAASAMVVEIGVVCHTALKVRKQNALSFAGVL